MPDTSALSPEARAVVQGLASRLVSFIDLKLPTIEAGMASWETTAINLAWVMLKPKIEPEAEAIVLYLLGSVSASDVEMLRSIFAQGEAILTPPTAPQ
jgi:hypothetical protein